MQLLLQTAFSSPSVVYDSDAPSTGEPSAIKKFLAPVVQVKQGDMTLYKTEEFYPDNSTMNILIAVAILAGIGYGAYRLLR